jgi:dipeptidase E
VRELLLLSNSISPGLGPFEHARDVMGEVLPPGSRALFIPFAGHDLDEYASSVSDALRPLDVTIVSAHDATRPLAELAGCDAVLTGGGNSFRLLKALQGSGLLAAIRERAESGMPYIGSSAGSNMACPTLRTTNDMPIVQPASFDALGLIPFQLNPHYLDPDPDSTHQGETRQDRLREFLEENDVPVLGLREGSWLRVSGEHASVGGTTGARLFIRGQAEREIGPGTDVSDLLAIQPRFDIGSDRN